MNRTIKREKEIQEMEYVYEGCYYINRYTDLTYNYKDDCWRIIDWANNRHSVGYSSKTEACKAYIDDTVKWEQ